MPQTIILKGQQHNFPAGAVAANMTIETIHPASGSITYALGPMGPIAVPLPGGTVYSFVLPVNGNALTVIDNSTSGLSCRY
ncbi:MAG: hypothetical protein DCF28_03930 [Alphaproteobacteria bacterium]|nr:MAG: hypothetical protein DCF28_03930 [Alphaproteobacteria bacterium]PZO37469.1 MAG: hypothetical protein DCE92_07635 [Alphaproteobacteria bacterium]